MRQVADAKRFVCVEAVAGSSKHGPTATHTTSTGMATSIMHITRTMSGWTDALATTCPISASLVARSSMSIRLHQ
jgi:hypothetical protein